MTILINLLDIATIRPPDSVPEPNIISLAACAVFVWMVWRLTERK